MSGADLSVFTEIALLIFLAVFVGVALRALFASRHSMDAAARMPLNDDLQESRKGDDQ
jgi:cbb3-type cytochrome oxidase subunit 3